MYSIDTTKKFVTRYNYGPPSNGTEDEMRARVNIISGDEDACSTTLELMDSKCDTTRGNVHIAGCELSSGHRECWMV